jgi:polar amino acid transport system substrate-binding protein
MAASPKRSVLITIALAVTVWVWALAGTLFLLRWYAVERPAPPEKALFPYGEMRVGVDASYPPFAVATATDIFGLDIDLALALGEELNIPVRFVNLGYDGLYDALRTDQVDVLISALLVDPTRRGAVIYSPSYYNAGLVLVSGADSSVEKMGDLPGHRLAVEFGSQAQTEAGRWLRRVLAFEIRPYELPEYALDAARLGDADAALVDSIDARLYLRDHDHWEAQVTLTTYAPFAIATRADRPDRATALNAALHALIEDGMLEEIIARYL